MCGIVGYVGSQDAVPLLLNGLQRMEYRGYDSAGLAVLQGGKIEVRRSVGKLANLEKVVRERGLDGILGVGHTRWATHRPAPRYRRMYRPMRWPSVVRPR